MTKTEKMAWVRGNCKFALSEEETKAYELVGVAQHVVDLWKHYKGKLNSPVYMENFTFAMDGLEGAVQAHKAAKEAEMSRFQTPSQPQSQAAAATPAAQPAQEVL